MDIDQFFQFYNWEALDTPREFCGEVTCTDTLAPAMVEENIRMLHVCRDDKYNIQVKAEGVVSNSCISYGRENEVPAGTLVTGGTIVCDTGYEGIVTLQYCFSEGYTVHHNLSGDAESAFEASFRVYEVHWDKRFCFEDAEADTLVEWYLNGVRSSALFCDSSDVEDTVSRAIKRAGDRVHDLYNKTEHFSRDCLYIAYGDTGVLMRKVPPKYGPEWSDSIALEYRSNYGRIPDKEERKKVAEFLGFLLGRHLILVGDTVHCKDAVLELNMYNPYSKNTVTECCSNTRELVPVHQYDNECGNFRIYAQELLPVYLELRDLYGLNDVLERYWLANTLPIGVNLPILAGALEIMMKAWFKGKRSITKGVYIPAKQYEAVIGDLKRQVADALGDCEFKENILNKISNAYQMGVNDRYFIFLRELGLEYGSAEEACIRARNAFTHGENGMDDRDTLQKTKTMFLLVGRICLKLLGYSDCYIDETLSGYPRKRIDEKIG